MNKLIIASDGEHTALWLDGIFIGKGVQKLEFSTEGQNGEAVATIRMLEIDARTVEVTEGPKAMEQLTNLLKG